MKKIITAINNPKLNEELKKEKNFEVIGKDIQYKEAILEILERNRNIDLIILSEKISGEIKIEKLIEKIKTINEKIKIIFVLEKENNDLEKILIKNNIIDIYYNNKINLIDLIKIINKKEINMEEEIIKLRKIIEEKNIIYDEKINKEKSKLKNKYINKIKRKIKKQKNEITNINNSNFKSAKIITFSGNHKSGKSIISLIVSQYLAEKNNRVLLIDGDLEKQDLNIILRKDKKIRNKNRLGDKKEKINNTKMKSIKKENKLNNKYKKLINKKDIIYYYQIKNKINLCTVKINKNLYFVNYLNSFLINKITKKEQTVKNIVLFFFKVMQKNYDFIIIDLSKSNLKVINKEILENSCINFVLMEPNLLGVKEIQRLLKSYCEELEMSKEKIYIISNKKNINSIDKNLISNCIPIKNKILELKENKFYNFFINNQNLKKKMLLENKIIEKEINKIINKIYK